MNEVTCLFYLAAYQQLKIILVTHCEIQGCREKQMLPFILHVTASVHC